MKQKSKSKTAPSGRIIEAAKVEFAERGLTGSRVESIARRAGVNPALVLYYFKSKDALYTAILREIFGELDRENLIVRLKDFQLRPPQKLYIAVYLVVRLFLKPRDPDYYRIVFHELADGGVHIKKMALEFIIPERREMVLQIIRDGIETGDFRPCNPLLVVHGIFSYVTNLVLFSNLYNETALKELLYGGNSESVVLDHILQQVFIGLDPGRKNVRLPEMPGEILQFLDEIIKNY
ncbi:MAG TPA: TetR/AcrR family transcriptional regulator [Spirochaetota bacterium]|nr:TetR/AcrR family transcriptional regulator [Spirochaetota bacterium]